MGPSRVVCVPLCRPKSIRLGPLPRGFPLLILYFPLVFAFDIGILHGIELSALWSRAVYS